MSGIDDAPMETTVGRFAAAVGGAARQAAEATATAAGDRREALLADLRAAREEVQRLRDQFDERLSVALDDFDLPGVMAERDALQGRIDAALTVLDVQWRWCYGRKLVSPNLVRAALCGSSD